ncbi:MAG: hypothetical protein R6W82_01545 [bacterium]
MLSFEERPGSPPWMLERVARDGPRWPAEIRVDVVARVRSPDGTVHLIRARNQRVHTVY